MYVAPKEWTSEFTRCVYIRADRPRQVLVQYVGDETKAGQFPHGNSLKANRNYTRTQPSVISSVRDAGTGASGTVSAQRLYQTLVVTGSSSAAAATAVPRNTQQVKNTLKVLRNRNRLTQDALYNLHELAYDFDFVQHISTYPDLSIVLYHPDIIDIFRSTLSVGPSQSPQPTQQLSYDTTFVVVAVGWATTCCALTSSSSTSTRWSRIR